MTPVVALKGVGKRYRISSSRSSWFKDLLRPGKESSTHEFWAVEDVNLEVEPGATLGIVGRNGAGKSTLLRIISGVSRPTTGEVQVNGRLAAIFSTGAGFNPEFTGRENVMLNGLILGIDRNEMLTRFDDIAAFADIGEFMDQPIKTYSSGMRSRLGFAVAVNVDSDVLVIDEALSAGDAAFKKKALQRMYDLRDSGTTVLFVSHSLGMVKKFCTEAVLLHQGRVTASGSPEEVVTRYRALLEGNHEQKDARPDERQLDEIIDQEDTEDLQGLRSAGDAPVPIEGEASKHRGSATAEARILRTELLDEAQRPTRTVASGSTLTVRVHLEYLRVVESSAVDVNLRDGTGLEVASTDTVEESASLAPRTSGERIAVDVAFRVPLRPGKYSVEAVLSRGEGAYLDRSDTPTAFQIVPAENGRLVRGLVYLPATVDIHARDLHPEQPSRYS
jgi:ABC-type polysaccharide/polyol phosphate transport system ATPase subunit